MGRVAGSGWLCGVCVGAIRGEGVATTRCRRRGLLRLGHESFTATFLLREGRLVTWPKHLLHRVPLEYSSWTESRFLF